MRTVSHSFGIATTANTLCKVNSYSYFLAGGVGGIIRRVLILEAKLRFKVLGLYLEITDSTQTIAHPEKILYSLIKHYIVISYSNDIKFYN